MELQLAGAEGENSNVVLHLTGEGETMHSLSLSVFDVGTLVSMLYAARADALSQKPDKIPETMMPIQEVIIGGDAIARVLTMRLRLTDEIYQDYYAVEGSEAEGFFGWVSNQLAKESGASVGSWSDPGTKQH